MIKWGTISIVLVIVLTSCNNVKSGEDFQQGRSDRKGNVARYLDR